jgi:GrpB-like predicted nucleotidyltransferase (UPF0157 family)
VAPDPRRVVYCLVPPGGADALDDVRAHYAGADVRVEVVVDRRVRERRTEPAPALPDRRAGNDRRRFTVPRHLAPLPPELAERTGRVRWIQRLLPVGAATERLSVEEVVDAVRSGDAEAPTELYWRCYERMRSRLLVLLKDPREADGAVVRAFGRVLDGLDDSVRSDLAFEDLLYDEVDAVAADVVARRAGTLHLPDGGLAVQDPELDEAVRVVDHDPVWPIRARAERERVLGLAGEELIAVEHIGSTAVRGVAARGTLDLLGGAHRLPLSAEAMEALDTAGYEDCGPAGTPGRVYLRRRGRTRVDLHLVAYDGALWRNAVAFRDHLRRHPADAERWAMVKREAARTAPTSALRYADLRRLALEELLRRVRSSRAEPVHDLEG